MALTIRCGIIGCRLKSGSVSVSLHASLSVIDTMLVYVYIILENKTKETDLKKIKIAQPRHI